MIFDSIGDIVGAVAQVIGAASAVAALFPSQSQLTGILLTARKALDVIGCNVGNARNAG